MKISFEKSAPSKVKTQAMVVFVHEDKSSCERDKRQLAKHFGPLSQAPFVSGDFSGKAGETSVVYLEGRNESKRLILAGLGETRSLSLETYRRSGAAAAKRAWGLKTKSLAFALPPFGKKPADGITALCEGALLALYKFDKYLSKKDENRRFDAITICSDDTGIASAAKSSIHLAQILAESTFTARDLANAPGNEIYPETLATRATEVGEEFGFEVTVLDESEIAELGMGGVMGVSQGSVRPPRFIVLEYGKSTDKTVVLVGKGVTFDTGGISIKPSAGMAEMKMDMSGAAAVIGAFEAVARLKLPTHLIGLIPAVENMPSGSSIRPGDIIRHFNGKTSEVDNTDAEGRLILADALAYAERYKPTAVIDLATLTGACVVALGHHATGMMGNDRKLLDELKAAGEKTYERVWELPLFEEYEKQIKSDVADVKNVGGRWAGAITAALFLKKFIGKYKWAHLDIAGTAMMEENGDYTQRGGSGVGVRLLAEFLRRWK